MALTVKNLPAMQETWVWSLVWKDPLQKGMATHSSILAWRIPWIRHDWMTDTITFHFHFFGLGIQKEAEQRLTKFCQENTLVRANTVFQQHKRWLYIWTSPNGQYQNQTDYIFCSQRWRSSIQSVKIRPRTSHGSDHELLICKMWA